MYYERHGVDLSINKLGNFIAPDIVVKCILIIVWLELY